MRDQRGFSIRDDPLAEKFGLKDVRRGREHTSSNTKSLTGVSSVSWVACIHCLVLGAPC